MQPLGLRLFSPHSPLDMQQLISTAVETCIIDNPKDFHVAVLVIQVDRASLGRFFCV